jgi:glycosyltransferase involved in cell wall biosynthesis
MRGPDVSVVIPTRNRWEQLARFAVPAALAQRGVSVEIVVVNDGSDATAPPVAALEEPRLRFVRHNQHLGVSAARNTGIQHSRGKWIAFLDDDDMWAPEKLASVLRAADQAGAEFGYSGGVVVDADLEPVRLQKPCRPDQLQANLRRRSAIFAGSSNVVARASLLDATGGFDEDLSTGEDWDMWLRLSRAGRAAVVEEPLIAYRASPWGLEDEAAYRADCHRLEAKHEDVSVDWAFLERWMADSLHRAGHRSRAARRYLATGIRYRDPASIVRAGSVLLDRKAIDRLRMGGVPKSLDWLHIYRPSEPDRE